MNDPSPLIKGDPDHKIVRPINFAYPGTWIFDKWTDLMNSGATANDSPSYMVNISAADTYANNPGVITEIDFKYAYATDGTVPDKQQYVLEKYCFLDSSNVEATIPGVKDTIAYLFKGLAYKKTPPAIPGYVYVGYRIDSGANNITYVQGLPPTDIQFNTQNYSQTVTLLYREAAEPITVIWKGSTYAGTILSLGSNVKYGYIGEPITLSVNDVTFENQWVLESPPDSYKAVFSNIPQTFTFNMKEKIMVSVIKVVFSSDDGNINFIMSSETLPNSKPYTQKALSLENYELTGYDIYDSYGKLLTDGNGSSAVIDPG
jgi:hypothetical protein